MEIGDVYDALGQRTGETYVRGEAMPEGGFYYFVEGFVVNSEGKYLIQKRAAARKSAPGIWAATSGRAVTGETLEEAMCREFEEELGLSVRPRDLKWLLTETYENRFGRMYILRRDLDLEDLVLQKEEVEEVRWAAPKEIRAMAEAGEFYPYRRLEETLKFGDSPLQLAEAGKKEAGILLGVLREAFLVDVITEKNEPTNPAYQTLPVILRQVMGGGYIKILYGAELAGGAYVTREEGRICRLHIFFLSPKYQDMHLGEQAMERLWLLFPEAKEIVCDIPERYAKRTFFPRMGFQPTGGKFEREGTTFLEYRKQL